MNQINPDAVSGLNGNFFNKAKNMMAELIADGEAREYRKLYPQGPIVESGDDALAAYYAKADARRGDPLGN